MMTRPGTKFKDRWPKRVAMHTRASREMSRPSLTARFSRDIRSRLLLAGRCRSCRRARFQAASAKTRNTLRSEIPSFAAMAAFVIPSTASFRTCSAFSCRGLPAPVAALALGLGDALPLPLEHDLALELGHGSKDC